MRSVDDLTARARIRDQALELFAARGADAVSVRDIAAAAGVSHALVLHHYGSKQRLREVVDEYVAGVFDEMFAAVAADPGDFSGGSSASFAELMLAAVPPGSPIPAYLRRLLLNGDAAGQVLFRQLFDAGVVMIEQLTAAGSMRGSADVAVRAAFLTVNDLAMVLLRDQLTAVLGVDPLSPDGMRRWAAEVVTAYTEGVFTGEVS
ncbi:TetR/AcrR family transcriptional regulator [Kribbella sp. NBC_01484]|uniref:TetR/AcrR family transcriptional regulator n=1 Tax=Kribbella sp. NBC_01484 TaxID=2903579 RepID=UPI002E315468|nr:TetR family transcriptional regulator [Kribbella sp. NBC_01484]